MVCTLLLNIVHKKIEEIVYKTSEYWSSERTSMSWLDQIHTSFSDSKATPRIEEIVDKNSEYGSSEPLNKQFTRSRYLIVFQTPRTPMKLKTGWRRLVSIGLVCV